MAKNWFVTGASRGLGRAIVETALEAGDRVTATSRSTDSLADLVERYPDTLTTTVLDVTDFADAALAVNEAANRMGSLDVLVNNAGYGDIAAVEDVTEADFRAQIDVNFYGVVAVTKAAVPILRRQGAGHVVQISSVGGRVANPGLAAYQAAKWAVEGFSEVLSQELASFGVKITLIEPGALRTDWAGSSMTIPDISEPYQPTIGAMAEMVRGFSGQQPGDPKKVAAVIRDIANDPNAPLRLLMGADAFEIATKYDEARGEADRAWKSTSESIAFDAA